VDGIVNLFEEFFLLEGCGVGLYSLSFYNLSVGSPYARPKKCMYMWDIVLSIHVLAMYLDIYYTDWNTSINQTIK